MKLPAYPRTKPSGVEWLGDIAHDWTISPIKHLVSTPVTDGPHETPEIFDVGIPFVSAEAIRGGKINFGKIRGHITVEDHKRFSRKYKPRRGDIYLIKSGATTGRIAMVDAEIEFNIWSPLAAIRCEPKKIDRLFLFFYMQSKEFQTAVELSWSFGTQQNIGMGVIQNLSVPLPSLPEQRAIAAFLDLETGRVDRLVAKKRELIERLKEKRTALISRTVTRGLPPARARAAGLSANPTLKPSGIEWIGDVPKHWQVTKMSRVCATIRDGTHNPPDRADGIHRLLSVRNVQEGRFTLLSDDRTMTAEDFAELQLSYTVEEGDIVLAIVGATTGKSAIVGRFENVTVQRSLAILRPNKSAISSSFLHYVIQSPVVQTEIELTIFKYSAQPGIYLEDIGRLLVVRPPLPEQVAITAYLDEETAKLDALVGKVEAAVERLQEYRTALITAAVTGKIDVRSHASPTPAPLRVIEEIPTRSA